MRGKKGRKMGGSEGKREGKWGEVKGKGRKMGEIEGKNKGNRGKR